MDNKTRQALISVLAKASSTKRPVTIKQNGKSGTVVLPISDHQEFYAEGERKLQKIRTEMTSILAFIRGRLRHRPLEEIEAKLAADRQKMNRK